MPTGDHSKRPKRAGRQRPGTEGAKDLIDLLFAAAAQLRQNFATVASDFDLSPLQARALACLSPEKPMSMRELANAVGCDASTVTDIIDRLEALRMVERRPDTVDRRITGLTITASGLSTRASLFPRVLASAPVSRLTAEERAELRELLGKIVGPGAFPEGHAGPPPLPVKHPRDD